QLSKWSTGGRPILLLLLVVTATASRQAKNPFLADENEARLTHFSSSQRSAALNKTREMFYFGYDNYMEWAWPADELDPIHCTGRGHDHARPDNININDVLGDYSLTLVDTLDTLVVMGDERSFKQAVRLVIDTVTFDKNTTVQVFEATIRVMGSLLSAHLIASDESRLLGDFFIPDYDGELLDMARDLAVRLMPAFEGTRTGLPYPRVNLQRGVLPGTINETCTAGAGSLLLEFGLLSRLTGDPSYASLARRINRILWKMRNAQTGLLGNVVDIQSGAWLGHLSGLGAGLDSFYEYMLKAFIMFGEKEDLEMFNESYANIQNHLRRGRVACTGTARGEHPIYVNVDARDGSTANTWIDALQAAFPAVQTLAGDVEEAICHHMLYYGIWKKYGVLPERFNWITKSPDVAFYPLRPELAESTYHLYRATKNPFYLHVGAEILESIDHVTRVQCGFATVHDVNTRELEDRMESFFLSETIKYLYLLFDDANPVNVHAERLIFSTEGHLFPVAKRPPRREASRQESATYRRFWNWQDASDAQDPEGTVSMREGATALLRRLAQQAITVGEEEGGGGGVLSPYRRKTSNESCESPIGRYELPVEREAMTGVFESIGVDEAYWWM
ncbi:hypothetical protein PFISCL1PPCAC_13358, partial [Pristionchus fissidentatus]